MKIIKFRRPHFKYADDSFSHFSYWGVNLPLGNSFIEFTSPSTNNSCYHKEDQMFAGLSDKQGKEIYEGDIFQVAKNKIYSIRYIDKGESNFETYFATFILWADDILFFPIDDYAMIHGEVIGNIYETPELL